MTREEAISWLVSLTEHEGEDVPIYDTDVEALDMAISALEHPERNVVAIVPCGDTISRQAVIDLMMQKWGENFSGDDAMQECIDAIRVMPSVTPQEPQSFKWCTDCKEYDQEKHCCHRYSKVIRDTVAEIKQEPIKGHWHRHTNDIVNYCECSECGIKMGLYDVKNYCPNCGSRNEVEK